MHPDRSSPAAITHPTETANDRLKRRATLWQANAIVVAVAAHFAVLALWPTMTAAVPPGIESDSTTLIIYDPPVPDPPKEIARPAAPVIVSDAPDVSVPIPSLQDWAKPTLLAPPPAARGVNRDSLVDFVRSAIRPEILNQAEVERALVRHYPPMLRDAGIGGDVTVLLWLDEDGRIVRAEVGQSSGRPPFDQAALEVVKVIRLRPALNMGKPTRVIVALPIRFVAR